MGRDWPSTGKVGTVAALSEEVGIEGRQPTCIIKWDRVETGYFLEKNLEFASPMDVLASALDPDRGTDVE